MNAVRQYQDNSTIERGNQFQDFCMLRLNEIGIFFQVFTSQKYQYEIGESPQGYECKADYRAIDRLSIEVQERRNTHSPWVASGINRRDNTRWIIQGNERMLFVFEKKRLQELHTSRRFQEHQIETVKKFYLPLDIARRAALHVWEVGKGWTK